MMEVFEYSVSYVVDRKLSDECEVEVQEGYIVATDVINAVRDLNEAYSRILKFTIEPLGVGNIIEKCKDKNGVTIVETFSDGDCIKLK